MGQITYEFYHMTGGSTSTSYDAMGWVGFETTYWMKINGTCLYLMDDICISISGCMFYGKYGTYTYVFL